MKVVALIFSAILAVCTPAHASAKGGLNFCFAEASLASGIPEDLLRLISDYESGMNPRAVHRNADGTEDICHMQVNASEKMLDALKKKGISRQDLFDPCICTFVGTSILLEKFKAHGYSWTGLGYYNANSEAPRIKYEEGLYRHLKKKAKHEPRS